MGPRTDTGEHAGRFAARLGARLAMAHLLELGHRKVAILAVLAAPGKAKVHPAGGPKRMLPASAPREWDKLLGYGHALSDAGLTLDVAPIIETMADDPLAGAFALDHAPEATGFVAMSDQQAVNLLAEAGRRGIAVSVVGYGNTAQDVTTIETISDTEARLVVRGSTGPVSAARR